MVSPGALDAIRKHLAETVHRLAFPRAHLVRMHFVLRRHLLDRPITAQRIQRYSGLEISRKPASFVHLCTPPLVGAIHLKPLSDFPGPPHKLNSIDVIDVLTDLFILRGVPAFIRSDNGPEFVAETVRNWINAVGAKTAYIKPGSPWENGYCENFNARYRH